MSREEYAIPLNARHIYEIIDDIQQDIADSRHNELVGTGRALRECRLTLDRIEAKLDGFRKRVERAHDNQLALSLSQAQDELEEDYPFSEDEGFEDDGDDCEDDGVNYEDDDDLPF